MEGSSGYLCLVDERGFVCSLRWKAAPILHQKRFVCLLIVAKGFVLTQLEGGSGSSCLVDEKGSCLVNRTGLCTWAVRKRLEQDSGSSCLVDGKGSCLLRVEKELMWASFIT